MKLYGYFRSSAAYRLRIALNLKGLSAEQVPVNLLKGEQKGEDYKRINPQGLVPSLATDQGAILTQSPAILEWLEDTYPNVPLLPADPLLRARVRSLCMQIACDVHPICNLRVLKYVANDLGAGEEGKIAWIHHWISEGFAAMESQLGDGPYCLGESLTLADVYLIPQVFNALRFKVPMAQFPKIMAVYNACNQVPAFQLAAPDQQPDAS
ncbi:maleylacetoacetate isomerase [Simiduia agarivorans]|uniref:Maleylacetoacetate isomerase n=1 Tax=Simiduia agarivorans (strain DSM 21679 / JCM 13881 / BCRC 17597 / SA1) TaxID=1117647 RepID=K4KJK0_SIMAS|nr:maleylacetoacetate isomerase [Simiduia agarivorans]AFU98173.1 maleylacetoacetate isomerase [Simiduia agarivorans SA1 = DSM 21679]